MFATLIPHMGGMGFSLLKCFCYFNYIKCQALNKKSMFDYPNCQFTKKKVSGRNCTKCSELYGKVMFANPPPPRGGINFIIKFSLLGMNEISRSALKGHCANHHFHVSVGRGG